MKDIRHETAKLIAATSNNLAQVVASAAFEFWQRKDFRLYVGFENLSQTEQDRMFNELEVSILGLFVLQLESMEARSPEEEKKTVFRMLKKDITSGFIQFMADQGIQKQYLSIWQKLIDMRLKEYRTDLQTALSESKSWKEFQGDEETRVTWARIETITIDCLTHIRRGNVQKDDPLWKLIRKWLISLDAQLQPIAKINVG